MIIIAIDPGSEQSAQLVWNGNGVLSHSICPNDRLFTALKHQAGCVVACETIASFGLAVGAEVFETCYVIGRIMEICYDRSHRFHRVLRKDVKMHLCNSVRAKDPNVRQALIDRLGPVGTKNAKGPLYGISSHSWSALAIAVTAYDRLNAPPTEIP